MVDPRTRLNPDPMVARDFKGYGERPPDPEWPNNAKIAVNFNLNVEGGGEATPANGDLTSEGMLNDIGVEPQSGRRNPLVESVFEFGSRRGVWRVLDAFREHAVTVSVLGVARSLEQNPELARAFVDRGHEVVSHGYRWIDYGAVDEETERSHIRRAVATLTELTGTRPVGWMTGRPGANTRRLLVEEGGFLYDRDSLADELPYWVQAGGTPTWSFRIPMRQTTIVSTRTVDFRRLTTSSPTCATPSTSSTAKEATARPSCCRSGCTTA